MKDEIIPLIDESVKTENLMEKLYQLYSQIFPEHSDFFIQLSDEEKTHASLLTGGKKYFIPHKAFPEKLLYPNLKNLKAMNFKIEGTLEKYRTTPPAFNEACNYAMQIEKIGAEAKFNNSMTGLLDNNALVIMQTLNQGFKNHAERILYYSQKKV